MNFLSKALICFFCFFTFLHISGNSQTVIACGFCKGTGKQISPIPCKNCANWSDEYKRKVPCHVCKDKRVTPAKGKCIVCNGTGKINLSELTSTNTVTKKTKLKKEPKGTYYRRAAQNLANQEYELALENSNSELQLYPNQTDVYIIRGMAKFKLYDSGGAIEDANKAIKLSPNSADAYFLRGIVKKQITDKEGACLDLNKAIELGSNGAKTQIIDYCSDGN